MSAEIKAKLSTSLSQNKNFGHENSILIKMLKDIVNPKIDWKKRIKRLYISYCKTPKHI